MAEQMGNVLARRSTRTFTDDGHATPSELPVDGGLHSHRKDCCELEDEQFGSGIVSRRSSNTSLPSIGSTVNSYAGSNGIGHDSAQMSSESLEEAKDDAFKKFRGRPVNFGTVLPGVYRSGFPMTEDLAFLKTLGLKTILTLVQKTYPTGYQEFIQANGIRHIVIEVEGTKRVQISPVVMTSILEVVLNRHNYPLLIHCNHGKHRTGCVVAVIRKIMGWTVDSIIEEYSDFARPKTRKVDITYIRGIDLEDYEELVSKSAFHATSRCPMFRWSRMTKISILTAVVLGLWAVTMMDFSFLLERVAFDAGHNWRVIQ